MTAQPRVCKFFHPQTIPNPARTLQIGPAPARTSFKKEAKRTLKSQIDDGLCSARLDIDWPDWGRRFDLVFDGAGWHLTDGKTIHLDKRTNDHRS
jgi:hypothetical protein